MKDEEGVSEEGAREGEEGHEQELEGGEEIESAGGEGVGLGDCWGHCGGGSICGDWLG